MKYVVYGLMIYAFIAASSAKGQSLFDGLLAAGAIYVVYSLIKNKGVKGTKNAEFREEADKYNSDPVVKAERKKQKEDAKEAHEKWIDGIVNDFIKGAELAAKRGARSFRYDLTRDAEECKSEIVAKLLQKGLIAKVEVPSEVDWDSSGHKYYSRGSDPAQIVARW